MDICGLSGFVGLKPNLLCKLSFVPCTATCYVFVCDFFSLKIY